MKRSCIRNLIVAVALAVFATGCGSSVVARSESEMSSISMHQIPGMIGQSAERIDGKVYLLSSESTLSQAKVIEIDDDINVVWEGLLYRDGVPLLAHPTALAVKEGFPSYLAGQGVWYVIDWELFRAEGDLDNAVIREIPDELAWDYMRAEYVETLGETYLASGDYSRPDENQLRLYDPIVLAEASSTLSDGVLVDTFRVPQYVQSYSFEKGILFLVRNIRNSSGWAVDVLDLDTGEMETWRRFRNTDESELEGYRILDDGSELFLTGDPGGGVFVNDLWVDELWVTFRD